MMKSDKIKVSVVIPLYNKAKYLQRTLDSVLAQTHTAFELIVVDDGSTDGGGDIVARCNDPRVRLVVQQNAGECAARNRGVRETTTELIAFIDADDEWLPDFLETVLALHEKFPEAGVWATAYAEMRHSGMLRQLPLNEEIRMHPEGLLINFFRFSVQIQQPFNATSTMVLKDALLKSGGFPEGLVRLGDTDTLFRMALRYPTAYCPVAKAIYHMDADDRTDVYAYSGNYPFFNNAMAYQHDHHGNAPLDEDVLQYLGHRLTGGLYSNWLAGNRDAMREIIRNCGNIKGYRLLCLWWRIWSHTPYWMVVMGMRVRSRLARLAGRQGLLPRVRNIYRSDSAGVRTDNMSDPS